MHCPMTLLSTFKMEALHDFSKWNFVSIFTETRHVGEREENDGIITPPELKGHFQQHEGRLPEINPFL